MATPSKGGGPAGCPQFLLPMPRLVGTFLPRPDPCLSTWCHPLPAHETCPNSLVTATKGKLSRYSTLDPEPNEEVAGDRRVLGRAGIPGTHPCCLLTPPLAGAHVLCSGGSDLAKLWTMVSDALGPGSHRD